MTPGDASRLAALLGGDDPAARAALARAAGSELARIAYVVLQQRSTAEIAAAAAIAAAVRRARTTGRRPTGTELHERLVAETLAEALRRYGGMREVDPLASRRPDALPAEPGARAVIAGVIIAGLPLATATRLAGVRAGRAQRILRDAVAAAGSEDRLREAVAAQLAPLPLAINASDVEGAASSSARRWWTAVPGTAVVGAALAALLLALATTPPVEEAEVAAPPESSPDERAKGPPPILTDVGVLPTLETCGIGPPDARLAYAGWLTVEDLGAAPPDADPDEPFYALVPAGDAAWNPPGLSRRIMPAVRGRLACLSTANGLPPTVVGLPSGWTPPRIPRHQLVTMADCQLRPADAPLAYRGWLTAEQLGEPLPQPVYAVVTEGEVSWIGPTRAPWPPAPERDGRFACFVDPETGEPRTLALPDGWAGPGKD